MPVPPQNPQQSPPDLPQDSPPRRADRHLLELLLCPVTKTPLDYKEPTQELVSRAAQLAYPIHNGVPLMIREAARPLDEIAVPDSLRAPNMSDSEVPHREEPQRDASPQDGPEAHDQEGRSG